MLYAFLCYNNESVVTSWTKEEDDAVMAKLDVVHEKLVKARPLRAGLAADADDGRHHARKEKGLVLDGPYAETKEQLLGFYVIDCDSLDEALEIARELAAANPGGAYEMRPVRLFLPGGSRASSDRCRLDRRGARRRPPAGGGGAAALFPRSRPRRGGLPGGVPARA